MTFNSDRSKQAQEVFIRQIKKVAGPSISLNNKPFQLVSSQKHSGLTLGTSLTHQSNYI